MNTFYETVNERKALNASARRRVNGSHSKKCSLPSDNLTAAQRKKLDGPCVSYSLRKPISWADFRDMPLDLQNRYLEWLQNEFRASVPLIATHVLGTTTSAFYQYARHVQLTAQMPPSRTSSTVGCAVSWTLLLLPPHP